MLLETVYNLYYLTILYIEKNSRVKLLIKVGCDVTQIIIIILGEFENVFVPKFLQKTELIKE